MSGYSPSTFRSITDFDARAPGAMSSFSKTRWENGRARNIMRSAFLSPKEYRDFAAQCLRWAFRAKREEHKNMMLQMADHWMQTAQKLERADTCVPSGARLASTPTPQDDARQKPLQDDFKGASR
jgi:hypothetical protein